MITKKTIENLDPAAVLGRRALVRVDFNVPVKEVRNSVLFRRS